VTSLDPAAVAAVVGRLAAVDAERARRFPGDSGDRQPVHTCYVPAGQITDSTPGDWGAAALALLDEHGPGPVPEAVLPRVLRKLGREPVEDLRIDFEDGYGAPADDVEDADAVRSARSAVAWRSGHGAPPWFGIRVKSFDTPSLRDRSIRTLDLFVTALLDAAGGPLPDGFVVTFPKVTHVAQVEVFAELLGLLEGRLGLPAGAIRVELQVETAQAVLDAEGRLALPRLITAGAGRVTGLHFGTYDYTAALGLSAADQHLAHSACDFARHVMQLAAAQTGVQVSDGSSNVLPVGQRPAVLASWRTHFTLVQRSLSHGFYQGWDLHPGQLVTRYAAGFAFFRAGLAGDAARLRDYLAKAGGAIADEPATAQALSRSFLRALECGAVDAAELTSLTGLDLADLRALSRREVPVTPRVWATFSGL
jgi:citrate lyase beta subunit